MSDILHWKFQTKTQPKEPAILVKKLIAIVSAFHEALIDETKLLIERPTMYLYPEVELAFVSQSGCFDSDFFTFGIKDSGMINVVKWETFGGAGTVLKANGLLPLLFLTYLSKQLENIEEDIALRFSNESGDEVNMTSWNELSEFLTSLNEDPDDIRGWAVKLGLAKELFKFTEAESSKPSAYF